jgi:23S rRNA (uracil-5-)-methyltransferase RumA
VIIKVRSGEIIDLDIIGMDTKGFAYGYYDNKRIYVKYAIPGDKVRVKLYLVRRGRRGRIKEFWGDIVDIVDPSPDRIEPKCKHFGLCGGCRYQNWSYDSQLNFKKNIVLEAVSKYGLSLEVSDPIPSPKLYYYRNRMDYPVGIEDGSPIIGLKMVGRWDIVVPLEECFLMSDESIEIIKLVREFMVERNIEPYDIMRHKGFMRYVVIREGKFTGDRLVSLVTSVGYFPYLDELIMKLRDLSTGIVWSINPKVTDISIGSEIRSVYGKDYIDEDIRGIRFHIHPNAFFQTNSYQTIKLVELVEDLAGEGDMLLDVYSGVGLFALSLSDNFKKVYGVEIDEYSTYSADINIKRLGEDITFFRGAAEDLLPIISETPTTVIVDPPRPGLSRKVIDSLLALKPGSIVYVSCNPDTLSRDITFLSKEYVIDSPIIPLDMFPQTPHIECVVRLTRK